MGAEGPLVAHPFQLAEELSIFHGPLADANLEGVGLGVAQVDVADVLEDRFPRRLFLVPVDEVARVERHTQPRHIPAERSGCLGVVRHSPRCRLDAHHRVEPRGDGHQLAQPFNLAVEGRAEFRRLHNHRHHAERFCQLAAGGEAVVHLRRVGRRKGNGDWPQTLQIAALQHGQFRMGRHLVWLQVRALIVHVDFHRREFEFGQSFHRLGQGQVRKALRADRYNHFDTLLAG